ncbi:MAG TPA: DUF5131 family protein [Armatimonadota bacterium]|nr:DUF5131 family protein [Armatimonadota bacterium]
MVIDTSSTTVPLEGIIEPDEAIPVPVDTTYELFPLSNEEIQMLTECEETIRTGLRHFIDVGMALKTIRDGKLYRTAYQTFEEYCLNRWNFVGRRGYQYITAAAVVQNLNNCSEMPETEAQVRPLAKLQSPKMQQRAWAYALESAKGAPVTKAVVENSVKVVREEVHREKESSTADPHFNRTNDRVDWAWWSWNPVDGRCGHECFYCYATNIRENRKLNGEPTEESLKPHLIKRRLAAPVKSPLPSDDAAAASNGMAHTVFVGSMHDLFGEWIPREWILNIFDAIRQGPDSWTYFFLTKNPKRYLDFIDDFPRNCWLGATVDGSDRTNNNVEDTENVFRELKKTRPDLTRCVSCEPLLGPVKFNDISLVNWMIIGCQSVVKDHPGVQPKVEWVAELLVQARQGNCKVYCKKNLAPTEWPRELPTKPSRCTNTN